LTVYIRVADLSTPPDSDLAQKALKTGVNIRGVIEKASGLEADRGEPYADERHEILCPLRATFFPWSAYDSRHRHIAVRTAAFEAGQYNLRSEIERTLGITAGRECELLREFLVPFGIRTANLGCYLEVAHVDREVGAVDPQ
jgi:hypothetical protein